MKDRIVIVGNSSIDNVITSDGVFHQSVCGGNCFHAAMAAGILSDKVSIITNIPNNYPEGNIVALEKHGVDVSCIRRKEKEVFLTELFVYEKNGDRKDGIFVNMTKNIDGQKLSENEVLKMITSDKSDSYTYNDFHVEYAPSIESISPDWNIRSLHLAPTTFSSFLSFLSLDVPIKTVDPGRFLIGMNYEDIIDIIKKTTVFIPSKKEMSYIFPQRDIVSSVVQLVRDSNRSIVCKIGHDGCILMSPNDYKCFHVGIYPEKEIVNLTGAGDSFCGALNAALVKGFSLLDSARIASVVAAKAIETVSAVDRNKIDWTFVSSEFKKVPYKEVDVEYC